MRTFFSYNTVFGKVTIAADDGALVEMAFGERVLAGTGKAVAVTNTAASQLQEYLAGKRRLFDVPLKPAGSDFQLLVWNALDSIPYGETWSYSQVAEYIGHPGSARAVGNANRANPLPIFIPCHRVVPAGGGLGGYAWGPKTKRFLLELEARNHRQRS